MHVSRRYVKIALDLPGWTRPSKWVYIFGYIRTWKRYYNGTMMLTYQEMEHFKFQYHKCGIDLNSTGARFRARWWELVDILEQIFLLVVDTCCILWALRNIVRRFRAAKVDLPLGGCVRMYRSARWISASSTLQLYRSTRAGQEWARIAEKTLFWIFADDGHLPPSLKGA